MARRVEPEALKIRCPKLLAFDMHDDGAVRIAFAGAPVLKMQQAWLAQPEERFQPGFVQVGWSGDQLLIFGQLTDDQLVSWSTEDNQILCRYGDAFEIFLGDAAGQSYVEFHIAPNGKRLQLLWPDSESFPRVRNHETSIGLFLVDQPMFHFSQWVDGNIWCLCVAVPMAAVLPPGTTLEERILRVSFSRYDYSSVSEPPVISSTSPHPVPSFHRQQEWTEAQCCDSLAGSPVSP